MSGIIQHYIGAAVTICIISGALLLTPFIIRNSCSNYPSSHLSNPFPALSYFAGGSLLSLGLIHILPESLEKLSSSNLLINGHSWQFGFTLAALGVSLMLGVEFLISAMELKNRNYGLPDSNQPFEISSLQLPFLPDEEESMQHHPINSLQAQDELTSESRYKQNSSAIITASALFVHSLFDGLAIGTQESATEIWVATAIIMCHKAIAALSLGVTFTTTNMSRASLFILGGSFILSTPIGLIFFAFIPTDTITDGILGCLSSGALVFVSFEISMQSFTENNHIIINFINFISFFCGSLLITFVTLVDIAYSD